MTIIFTPQPQRPATPRRIPDVLTDLGFVGWEIDGQGVIIPPLCEVPAGPFLMGIDVEESNRVHGCNDSIPQHIVTLPSYAVARFPLTNAEYAPYAQARDLEHPPVFKTRQILKRESDAIFRPPSPDRVVDIDWEDGWSYAYWLRTLTGLPWRLPTEAEWEKAARGDDGRSFPWGNDPAAIDLTPSPRIGQNPAAASPFGMEDAIGVAAQWVTSLRYPYPYRSDDKREVYANAAYLSPDGRPMHRRVKRGSDLPASRIESRVYHRSDDDAWSCLEDDRPVALRLVLGEAAS